MADIHSQICLPVAGRLRYATILAVLAQGVKLAIWLLMIRIIELTRISDEVSLWPLVGLFALTVLYYTCKIKAHDQSHYAAFQLEKILRSQLADKIGKLPLGTVREIGSGALAKVLFDDVKELHAFVADAPPLKAEAYSTPIFVLIALFWLDGYLALAVLVLIFILFTVLKKLLSGSQLSRREYAKAVAGINGAIVEYVQGMSTIRTFDAGQSSYRRFDAALADFNRIMADWLKRVGLPTRFARVLFTPMPMMLFLLLIGGYLHHLALISTFTLFSFLILAAGLIETMHPYMGLFHLLEKSRASIERINELKNLEILTALSPAQTPKDYSIRFEQVDFCYRQDSRYKLENINLNIAEKTFTAIIGASGSGKTTLINLLLRFWDVNGGKITVGGADIRYMQPHDLMSLYSVVFQDNFLFSGTIAQNIAYGLEGVSEERIIQAAKQACIHDFIMTLPEQYQTLTGERGQLLSGGQRQRITIARAFLQNRPILILDEPTAFSDAKNEAELMQVFRRLMQNKTVIMVAHRLSSIKNADQILYLQQGKVIACGSHWQLSTHSEEYRRLWQQYRQTQQWTL